MATPGQTPAHDVELARLTARYGLARQITRGVFIAVWIVTSWFPLRGTAKIAEALAGKETKLGITVSISVAIAISIALPAALLWRKVRSQGQELRRLRGQIDDLEQENDELRKRIGE